MPRNYRFKGIHDPVQADATRFIGRIVKKTGLTPTEIARESGLAPSTVTRIYPTPSVDFTLSSRSIAKIKEAFPTLFPNAGHSGTNSLSLSSGEDVTTFHDIAIYALCARKPQSNPDLATKTESGTRLDSIEAWEDLSDNPVSYCAWLEDLGEEEERYFGVYVSGDAMQPRLYPGEVAIIDSVKPVPVHSDAFVRVRTEDGRQIVFFARIAERTSEYILVQFYGAPMNTVQIARSDVLEMFPVKAILANNF